jgi:hypothetical protein
MQKPFRFRPDELLKASYASKCILSCLRCGLLVKKSTLKRRSRIRNDDDETSIPYVGCHSALLVGKAAQSKFVQSPPRHLQEKRFNFHPIVHFMASYYTRLAEYYRLAGGNGLPDTVIPRQEMRAIKAILHQSLCTTIQRYYKISKTVTLQRYGFPPGGYPVPNDDRPSAFRTDRPFRLWPCVRAGGCTAPVDRLTYSIQTPHRRSPPPRVVKQQPGQQQQQQQQQQAQQLDSSNDNDAAAAAVQPQRGNHNNNNKGPRVDLSPRDAHNNAGSTGNNSSAITGDLAEVRQDYELLHAMELNGGMMRRHTIYSKFPRQGPAAANYGAVYDRILDDGRCKFRVDDPLYPGFALTNKGIRWLQHVRPIMLMVDNPKTSNNKKKKKK